MLQQWLVTKHSSSKTVCKVVKIAERTVPVANAPHVVADIAKANNVLQRLLTLKTVAPVHSVKEVITTVEL